MNRVIRWSLPLLAAGIPALSYAQAAPPAPAAMPAGNYASICLDPSSAGISAVNNAADLLKSQGPDAAIGFFTGVLNETRNFAVKRMIRFQLVDLYKQEGNQQEALLQLEAIIKETPPEPAPSTQTIQLVPSSDTSGTQPPPAQQ
ncbi:MAG TPA: hypothetical protein VL992_15485 [Tepidisphaeraceae bacterium]|nr:hypothetical protein [Tepidisphaeraceae bacterium]